MPKNTVSLDDKYALDETHQLLTGTQAIVRLMLTQRARDVKAGLNTAGYVTGYRGSPIASLEAALLRAKGLLEPNHIKFMAGLNEDLAATALWGSQQAELRGRRQVRRRVRRLVRQGPRRRPHRRRVPPRQPCRHLQARRRARPDGRRPHLRKLHQRAPVRVRLPRLHDADPEPGGRAGDPRLRHPRLRSVALCRRVGRHQVREGQHRGDLDGRRPHRPHPDQDPRRFHAAARRASASASATRRWPRKRACTTTSARPSSPSPAPTSSTASSPAAAPTPKLGIITTGKSYLDVRQALDELGIDEVQGQPARHPPLQGRHALAAGAAGRAEVRAKGSTSSWWSRRSAR